MSRAWVTLATNDSYGLGALVLAHSLRRVESAYPAVILITPSVTEPMRDRLRAVFAEVITVDVLDSGDAAHLALLQRPELGITFTKIHCWSLTQYEKCVFLDADTLVVQNCDELFEREQLSAAPDVGWPDCFNSGVFVFTPSAETFSQIITFAQERGSFDGGDQGLLNSFFSDWAHGDISKHLPFLYNVTSAAFYSYLPALKHFGQNLKIIHFIGAAKPWLQQFNFESRTVDAPEHIRGLLQLWWDIFFAQVHSQLDVSMVEVEEANEVPTPALPPHDVSHQYHYQPTLDPDSEFAWHHPDAQTHEESKEKEIDMTEIHDPWNLYRGHIPPIAEDTTNHQTDLGRVEDHEEIRKYAWDYQAQDNRSTHVEHSVNQESIQAHHSYHHWHHEQHYEQKHEHHEHSHHHHDTTWGEEHRHNSSDHHKHTHSQDHHSHKHSQDHHTHTQEHNHSHHHEPNYSVNQKFYETSDHNESSLHKQPSINEEVTVHHVQVKREKRRSRRVRKLNRIDICPLKNNVVNGDLSETESESYEELMPRHPYDGFYLRHRITIDARGRKVCSHEIPPTPSPSPPPESPSPVDDHDAPFEDERPLPINNSESQTGVAGNLARVLPGASREALDELSRRQGWEAGNIDYMGADSFDNIWAKISQTLSLPRSSPPKQSPPRETAPEQVEVQSGQVVQEPVAEPVEVAKEAAPTEAVVPQEPAAVEPVPAPVEPTPAPVESTPAPVESAPAPVQCVPAPVPVEALPETKQDIPASPVEVPAPVVSSEKVAAPADIPVTVEEAAAEVPVTVEALPPVEVSAPAAEESAKVETAPVVEPKKKTEPTTPELQLKAEAPGTDSPPLATTPSKEEAPAVPAAKSEERRKPAGKLKLQPPAVADPLPTPDSELEDAAALAHAIIAAETTITAATPPAPATPAAPAPAAAQSLSVAEPEVPTPPVGAVSLAQIGVKSPPKAKPTAAELIESSVPTTAEASAAAPAEPPKKKIVKKVVKASADSPVPPPRKKEKKPKEK